MAFSLRAEQVRCRQRAKEDTMKSLPIIAAIASLGLAVTACDRSPVEIEDHHPAEPTLPPLRRREPSR